MNSQKKWVIIIAAAIILAVISSISKLYVDWLWFGSLSFDGVFKTTLFTKWGLGILVFLIAFGFIFANLMLTRRYLNQRLEFTNEDGREIIYDDEQPAWDAMLRSANTGLIFAVMSFLMALFVGYMAAEKWIVVQQYFHRVAFNLNDPIFNRDIGFYVFDLQFYQILYNLFMPILIFSVFAVGVVYLLMATFRLIDFDLKELNWPKAHLIVILGLIFLCKSWGYKLASYGILYSSSGVLYGAGYTDVHARLMAYKILMIVTLIVAAVLILNLVIKRMNWVLVSLGLWVGVAVIFGSVYPAVVQKLSVEPNEFNREKPYIENNIKYTRAAYKLNEVESKPYEMTYDLTWDDLQNNQATIENVRLWDWAPLKTTLQAIQEIRPYYKFHDIDIDRYIIDGRYRQVMLAPRELSQENTPKTWVNQRLEYTHGYGLTMSPVNEVAQEGLPVMFIKDIPPRSSVDVKVERPEVYFGEEPSSYVVVNSQTPEFDYPMGSTNARSTYQEDSGIKMGSLVKRLIFAGVLGDYRLLISSQIEADSQLLIYRNIMERVKKIAPFLQYDNDPYIVLNDDGKLYWMMDAYTTSENYPYSEPFEGRKNYIRNSVKVVIDAYTGKTTFYIADNQDPLIRSLDRVFPSLLQPLDKMPEGLKSHIRYPEDMFSIQANMYSLYHMTDPSVFYNKEDRWNIPQEIVGEKPEQVQPYYIIMQLPDEDEPEYILMLPFTPNTKQNMVGWMCARSDGENYGRLKVYDFSKQELIYGPMQIESRIDQNSEVSEQMTLWSQKGSSVYRGNLIVIPIENSMLYVEPIYLQAEQSRIPELRRVIVVYGDTVVMEPTLQGAFQKIFGQGGQITPTEEEKPDDTAPRVEETLDKIARQAKSYFDKAQNALKSGDWSAYGENIEQVGKSLERLISRTGEGE
ncbi:MAG: UPF0182 family protein [Syntrophomonadales bacterium]|jgi:uncharacterized membrane protein (UPF0182 family)